MWQSPLLYTVMLIGVSWQSMKPIRGRSGLHGSMYDCGVKDPRFESYRSGLCVYHDGHCHVQHWAPAAISRLTQPSTLRGLVKWVSAFVLSKNKKWRCWMRIVAACRQILSPSQLARFEGWRSPSAQSAFIRWTAWTLAMALSWWQHHKHYH